MKSEQKIRVLVVDDDRDIRTLLSSFLCGHGIDAQAVEDVAAMRARLAEESYDLIVLDLMMPGEDGLSALQQLQEPSDPPVIILSAIGADVDRIVGLEMGAQDYLAKPCNPRELLARIKVVLRRQQIGDVAGDLAAPLEEQVITFAGWRLALQSRLLYAPDGVVITLSDGEFRLLKALAERPGRVLSRDQLLDYSRGVDIIHYDRAIDVQISRLRRKMRCGEFDDEIIRTIRNEGYMFMPAVTGASHHAAGLEAR